MGLFDKLKNALFEVEYEEVEEEPKKEKKEKHKENNNIDEKPIAKKIVLPGKREEKIAEIQEEELIDEDFEIRPKNEQYKEPDNSFKFMDDADFKVDDGPQIIENINNEDTEILSEENVVQEVPHEEVKQEVLTSYSGVSPIQNIEPYVPKSTISSLYKVKERESRPYGMDPSYRISIKEYGSYENKDDKGYFKPSPIISPIYGILDKNYKKEDVVPKKEIRITTNYTRTNINVDDIRNKAYGRNLEDQSKVIDNDISKDDEQEDNLLVDLSEEKPEVKEITVGDAMEYFQDLGLEYNVDYVDATSKNIPKKKADELEKDIEENLEEDKKEEKQPVEEKQPKEEIKKEEKIETKKEEKIETKKEKVEELPQDEKKETVKIVKDDVDEPTISDDDNLFDLIDSMYKDE